MALISSLIPYDPNVKALIAFLKILHVKVNDHTVDDALQHHPAWPSLLCVSDALQAWHIPNGVGKIDTRDIDQVPTPFIAMTLDKEAPLCIVTDMNENTVTGSQNDYAKTSVFPRSEFIKQWNGVFLIAEPNETSGELHYVANKQKVLIQTLLPAATIFAILIFSLIYLSASIHREYILRPLVIYSQYFIFVLGMVFSSLLLWYEIDRSNPVLHKVCTGITKGDCQAILSGKQSKVFSWLSWSEVGFFYFTGGLLTLLFGGAFFMTMPFLGWLSLLAVPYTVFSVYFQWKVARQWCVLCLVIQAILLAGAVIALSGNLLSTFHISYALMSNIVLLYSLPFFFWYTIKPILLRLPQAKTTKREYDRLKFNTEIFDTLLKKQKEVTISPDGLGINIGNPYAVNTIIKVCNPYCGPCAKAHPQIEELIKANHNINAKIIFSTAYDENNPAIYPVIHLLAIAEQGDQDRTQRALDDWYLPSTKDYDVFATKYPVNGALKAQSEKIIKMDDWCKKTGIDHTPTIFINGFQLPDAYGIEDLKYFLLE